MDTIINIIIFCNLVIYLGAVIIFSEKGLIWLGKRPHMTQKKISYDSEKGLMWLWKRSHMTPRLLGNSWSSYHIWEQLSYFLKKVSYDSEKGFIWLWKRSHMTLKKVSYDFEKGLIWLWKRSHMTEKGLIWLWKRSHMTLRLLGNSCLLLRVSLGAGGGGVKKLELYIISLTEWVDFFLT